MKDKKLRIVSNYSRISILIIFTLILTLLIVNTNTLAKEYVLDEESEFGIYLKSGRRPETYGNGSGGAYLYINENKMEFTGDENISTSYEEHIKIGEDGYTDYYNGGISAIPPKVNTNDKYTITSNYNIPTDSNGNIVGKYELVMVPGAYNKEYNDFVSTMIISIADQIKYIEMKLEGKNKLTAEGMKDLLEGWGVAGVVAIRYTWIDSKGVTQKTLIDLKSEFYIMTSSQKALNDYINSHSGEDGDGHGSKTEPKPGEGIWESSHKPTMDGYINGVPYDISQGIPTSEYLHGSIRVDDIGYEYKIGKMTKTVRYTVTCFLQWDWKEYTGWRNDYDRPIHNEDGDIIGYEQEEYTYWAYDKSDTQIVTGEYTTHYFVVNYATMSVLSSGALNNEAVGEICSVGASYANGYVSRIGDIIFDESGMANGYFGSSKYGGKEGAIESAKGAIRADIMRNTHSQNDIMNIKGAGLSGTTPKGIPFESTPYQGYSSLTNPSIGSLSGEGSKVIPSTKLNGMYLTSVLANYRHIGNGFDGKTQSMTKTELPRVIVHTPVINRTTIQVNTFENQKINKTSGTVYLMLDESFTIVINQSGKHRSIPGYGTRMYNSFQGIYGLKTTWGKLKDVRIPFDVYIYKGNDKVFVPANTWISDLGLATADYNYMFTVPVWVTEQNYIIETRVIAENAQNYNLMEDGANLNLANYAAVDRIPVEVIGKIYDLRISNVTDTGWSLKAPGYLTAKEFPLGQSGQNTNTKYTYAPKLGYTFVFDFKTKGRKSNNIEIIPSKFYFVSKTTGEMQEVDLYYHTATDKFVKIEQGKEKVKLQANLKESFMKVVNQELIDSTRIRGHMFNYGLTIDTGSFARMVLPENLRLCYNNFAEYLTNKTYGNASAEQIWGNAGGRDNVIDSVGHWYAGYRLPASTRALPKGTNIKNIPNLNDNSKEFLKDGYILVKFEMKTIYKNIYGEWEYLAYMGPEALNEGRWGSRISTGNPQTVTLPNGRKITIPGGGAVAIYDSDLRSSNDIETSGTH